MPIIPLQRIDADGRDIACASPAELDAWIAEGEALHRAFRPRLGEDYRGLLETIAGEGGQLTQLVDGGAVRAIALWRAFHTTYCGRRFEIDDLVTDEAHRSRGHGRTLLDWLEARARALGCPTVTLNSATHRVEAHRFYFRQRYVIGAFHFYKLVVERG